MDPKPTTEAAYQALRSALFAIRSVTGQTPMLDGGTLLGFYREGTFCEDDHDDIDLTISAKRWDSHGLINAAMLAEGFEVYHMWPRDPQNNWSGQYAWKRDGVKIDLMYKETKNNRVWWTVYGGKKGVTYKSVPRSFVFDEISGLTEKIGIYEGDLLHCYAGMPKDPEAYLTYRYGEWQKKVHRNNYSCYTTDKAIVASFDDV